MSSSTNHAEVGIFQNVREREKGGNRLLVSNLQVGFWKTKQKETPAMLHLTLDSRVPPFPYAGPRSLVAS
jgi:hypothetical protein